MRVGIDCGLTGAIAFLGDNLEFINVVDMPVMALRNSRNQINMAELHRILAGVQDVFPTVYIELVNNFPGQGGSSMFSFGMTYGACQMAAVGLQMPYVLVSPVKWKKAACLTGKDKDMARTLAQQLYPMAPLGHKKDIGRADAILIARYGAEIDRIGKEK